MVSKMLKVAAVPVGLVVSSYGLYAVSDREAKGDRLNPHQNACTSVRNGVEETIQFGKGECSAEDSRCASLAVLLHTFSTECKNGEESYGNLLEQFKSSSPICKLGDSFVYLKNPPPEFLPRVGIISVSGLAGLVLARRGSRLKKLVYPTGLAALGASVCYPAHAVIFAKVTGKKLYSAGHWTYDGVSSLWRTKPQNEVAMPVRSEDTKEALREEDRGAAESPAEHREPTSSPAPPSSSLPIDPAEPSATSVPT
ncbi:unnamed protein product, partial [Ranitomeya imitator]